MSTKSASRLKKPTTEQIPPADESQTIILRERLRQQDELLQDLKLQHEQSAHEIDTLRRQRDVLERESYEAARTLKLQVHAAETKTASAIAAAELAQQQAADQQKTSNESFLVYKSEAEVRELDMRCEIASLKGQLQALSEFSSQKDLLEKDLATAQQKSLDQAAHHDIETAELHLRLHKLKEERDAVRLEMVEREQAAGALGDGSASDIVNLLQFNRKLVSQLKNTEKEIEVSCQRIETADRKCKELQLALKTSKGLEAAALEKCAKQSSEIQKLQQAIGSLETKLALVEQERTKAVDTQQQLQCGLVSTATEIETLKQQLKFQTKECQKLWKRCQRQAQEHSEVHAFLVTSIRMAKQQQQILKEKEQASYSESINEGTEHTSPQLVHSRAQNRDGQSVPSHQKLKHFAATLRESIVESGGKLDVSQLTWTEREQILRLLLAHINSSPCCPSLSPSSCPASNSTSAAAATTPLSTITDNITSITSNSGSTADSCAN